MIKNSSISFLKLIGVIVATSGLPKNAAAFSYNINDELLRDFALTNTYSPLEGAYSKGALGFSFGLGLTPRPFTARQRQTLAGSSADGSRYDNVSLLSAYLSKGFSWPVNFGVAASQIPGTSLEQVGAHLQWAVFEGFRRPSAALRWSFNHLNIPSLLSMRSFNVGAVVDYSFWSYGMVYGAYSLALHNAQYKDFNQAVLSLRDGYNPMLSATWYQQSYHYGLVFRIIPPIVSAAIEWQHFGDRDQILAKIAFGI
jgi:hypothetical protein